MIVTARQKEQKKQADVKTVALIMQPSERSSVFTAVFSARLSVWKTLSTAYDAQAWDGSVFVVCTPLLFAQFLQSLQQQGVDAYVLNAQRVVLTNVVVTTHSTAQHSTAWLLRTLLLGPLAHRHGRSHRTFRTSSRQRREEEARCFALRHRLESRCCLKR